VYTRLYVKKELFPVSVSYITQIMLTTHCVEHIKHLSYSF